MLIAHTPDGTRIPSTGATRGDVYVCPECHQPVIFKHGRVVIPHFAHKPDAMCTLATGESLRHMEMKATIADLFAEWSPELEVPMLPGRRADVVIGDVVVECQASPLSIDEWEDRTRSYNRKGYLVLWVWDFKRVAPRITMQDLRDVPDGQGVVSDDERRMPAEILHCHQMNYGSVYAIGKDPRVIACHFRPVFRTGEYIDQSGDQQFTVSRLKRTKYVELLPLADPVACKKIGPKGHGLVSFGEGVWFTTAAREQ